MRMSAPRASWHPPPNAPCDGRYHRLVHLLPRPHGLLAHVCDPTGHRACDAGDRARTAGLFVRIGRARTFCHLLEPREVEPCTKRPAVARQHYGPDLGVLPQHVTGLDQRGKHLAVQGVEFVRSVHSNVGDAAVDFDDYAVSDIDRGHARSVAQPLGPYSIIDLGEQGEQGE